MTNACITNMASYPACIQHWREIIDVYRNNDGDNIPPCCTLIEITNMTF